MIELYKMGENRVKMYDLQIVKILQIVCQIVKKDRFHLTLFYKKVYNMSIMF